MKSEFGSGLVICLVKFAEHFDNFMRSIGVIQEYIKDPVKHPLPKEEKASLEIWGTPERLLASKIEMWANGASDHLYEIEVPKGVEWKAIRTEVNKLQKIGLEMGHGFSDRVWKIEELWELKKLTRKIALMIDRKLGLKPNIGTW